MSLRICFAIHSPHGDAILDPEYCEEHPLGGTGTAVIKLAQSLRRLGADVTVATKPSQIPANQLDVFVLARHWELFGEGTRPAKLNYLWCQDDVDQLLIHRMKTSGKMEQVYQACDGLIMVSHYQALRWVAEMSAPPDKIFISTNGIDLPRFKPLDTTAKREPRAYYASTPFRGLAELLQFWPIVRQVVGPRARLSICSSLKVYGEPEAPNYEALYAQARQMDGVDYLGSVGQRQLREVAATCRALAYPCVFPETSCIVAMEAMAAGCVVVGTSLGALPETAWRNPLALLGEGWGDRWIEALLRVFTDDAYYAMLAEENVRHAQLTGWDSVARKWLTQFQTDLGKKQASA